MDRTKWLNSLAVGSVVWCKRPEVTGTYLVEKIIKDGNTIQICVNNGVCLDSSWFDNPVGVAKQSSPVSLYTPRNQREYFISVALEKLINAGVHEILSVDDLANHAIAIADGIIRGLTEPQTVKFLGASQ